KEGTFTIPAATILADGKRLSTQPQKLTVYAAPDRQQPASNRPVQYDDASTQTAERKVKSDDVFVRIILSKNSAYEQEAIGCTIKLYTKYSISSFLPTKQPAFDGFLIQELDVQPSLNEVETYNGQEYRTAVLKKCIIFPQKSGKLTINSGNYDLSVVQYDNVNMGMFQVRQPVETKIKVVSNSGSIDIKPLPSPRPEGFTGAVGRFSVDTRLVGSNFRTNDPATLIYTISGTGNIKYVKEPVIDFPSEFEQYTPKTDIQTSVSGNEVSGTITIDYTFVPQSVGNFNIGGDKFVYFNPSSGEYVTLSTPSYPVKVSKGLSAPAATADQKEIENKNSDIRFIYLHPKHSLKDTRPVMDRAYYWWLYVAVLGIAAGYSIINRRKARLEANVEVRRVAKAGKVARRRLKEAKSWLDKGDSDKFYAELLRAFQGYLADKLALPVSNLSRENIAGTIINKGGSEQLASAVNAVLEDCELARYTPESSSKMDAVYEQSINLIDQIEKIKA
nr:BatD family protein [Duncaniella sp.]